MNRVPQPLLQAVVILALLLPLYSQALQGEFLGDDTAHVQGNAAHLGHVSAIPGYFSRSVWKNASLEWVDNSLYRPVWLLWLFGIYHLWGEEPLGWHVGNVFLHALNTLLLLGLLRRLMPDASRPVHFLGMLIFALGPLSAQSTSWISGSMDVLLGTFVLLNLHSYLRYREHGGPRWFGAVLVTLAGALLTKETGAALLALLPAWELGRRTALREWPWRIYLGMAVVFAAYLTARGLALQASMGAAADWRVDAPTLWRLVVYGATYVRMFLWPWPLPFTLRHVPGGVGGILDPWVGLGLLVTLLWLAVRQPWLRLAVGTMLVPVSIPLLMALNQNGLFAARFLYVPHMGLALLVAGLTGTLSWRRWYFVPAMALLAGLATMTVLETNHWRDSGTWGRHLIRFDRSHEAGWLAVGRYHIDRRDIDEAVRTYWLALKAVHEPKRRAPIVERLATYLAARQQVEESERLFRSILDVKGYEHLAWNGIGNIRFARSQLAEAAEAYQTALRHRDDHFESRFNLGLALANLGHLHQAVVVFRDLVARPAPANLTREHEQAREMLRSLEAAMAR